MDKNSFEAGKAAGITQEKTRQVLEKVGDAVVSVRDSALGVNNFAGVADMTYTLPQKLGVSSEAAKAGQQVHATALGAVEAVKNATAAKK